MKVIATDLDGTLFYPRRYGRLISKKNLKFVRKFINDGNLLITSSSRSKYIAQKTANFIGNSVNAICCNGAVVIHNGEIIKDQTFEIGEVEKILIEAKKHINYRLALLSTRNMSYVYDPDKTKPIISFCFRLVFYYLRSYAEPYVRDHRTYERELRNGNVHKIVLVSHFVPGMKKRAKETVKHLKQMFPDAEFVFEGRAIEITPKDCTKAKALRFYLDKYKIPTDNIYVVGDGGNDISSFDEFKGRSFCLQHAPKNVKMHSSFVIRHFSDLEKYVYPLEENL